MNRYLVALALVFVALLAALPVVAQPFRYPGAIVGANVAASGTVDKAMFEIAAGPAGQGIIIFEVQVDAAGTYAISIDAVSQITTGAATVTQVAQFGPSPVTTVVRTGYGAGGPVNGSWLLRTGSSWTSSSPAAVFVPPGKFFTLRRVDGDFTLGVTVGYYELNVGS